MGANGLNLIWIVAALVMAASALAAQRAPLSFMIRSAIAWAAIILVVVVAVSHRYELQEMLGRVNQTLGIDDQQVSGETVRIRMSADGHFWARVDLDGYEQLMMIDTGATVTAISEDTAQRAGVKPDGLQVDLNTANGLVEASHGRVKRVKVGPLETLDMGVVISPAFGDTNVLGMNFLSRLGSWRVEGKTLVLEPDKNGGNSRGKDQGDQLPSDPA